VFKSEENYEFFLRKKKKYVSDKVETLAYCLMATHFHFLVFIQSVETTIIKNNFGILLSSYTKAINSRYKRHGSLFQLHTKARLVGSDNYLMILAAYIHQNPIRAGLIKGGRLEIYELSRLYRFGEYTHYKKGYFTRTVRLN
jgi:putative transposase